MEFRHLRYFMALADEGNFGRAARRLHISQPPLTRQIRQLEDEFGAQLFERTSKGVDLTEAGHLFREEAARILALAQQAAERTRKAGRGQLGRLDVGIFGSAVLNVIPRLILEFRRCYPEVEVHLHTMTRPEQVVALQEGRLTVGFVRVFPDAPEMAVETVLKERLMVAINRDNELSRHREIAVRAFAGQPLILFPSSPRPSLGDHVVALCHAEGFQPRVAQEVEDVVTSIALVSCGFGICVVPECATRLRLPHVVYRPLKGSEQLIELGCAYRPDDRSPILRSFLDVVRQFRSANEA
ncbi:MAG: LysR family transcriptional regulator [Burkholderiales bacterium]|nr:LysR family transcriptional regulator [Burkholderiales bacterium]